MEEWTKRNYPIQGGVPCWNGEAMPWGGVFFYGKIRGVECRALKDKNIEKCLKVAVLGGGVFLCTKNSITYPPAVEAAWKEMQGNLIMHEM